ncbi:MAG: thioesterase [Cytophagales bacterium CG12_big_fil_rev_8_21_14_0_65_40_12]|nr:MAG: thioesterase [Cytophagales bacterium CG12_big_fil_rev_8_21_14_0_65_40_12]PIW05920.1 MAG: thioesterase [Cytophagales bacterium CG17_big_fil_post_rev_8_21_14_2_50_40_13]
MYTANCQIRVRYAETDQMGYVYYGNYAMYYEVARVEALRQIGLNYVELEKAGIMMPVHENFSKYHVPAKYDDLLEIKVSIAELPKVRMRFDYEIRNQNQELINEGYTTLVFIDMKTNKIARAPQAMIEILSPFYHEK